MTASTDNKQPLLLFFHGLDSSCNTDKFTCIEHLPKHCLTVDYRQGFEAALETYDQLLQQKMREHDRVVLAGHSLGGWFANHFAHKYQLKSLLIAPCINPNVVLFNRAANPDDLPFPVYNKQMTKVIVEVDDEILAVATARRTLVYLPESWQVEYLKGGHHRIARKERINRFIDSLFG